MVSSAKLIELAVILGVAIVGTLWTIWLLRAAVWIRNRLAKKISYSKAETTVLLLAPIAVLIAWVLYAGTG